MFRRLRGRLRVCFGGRGGGLAVGFHGLSGEKVEYLWERVGWWRRMQLVMREEGLDRWLMGVQGEVGRSIELEKTRYLWPP